MASGRWQAASERARGRAGGAWAAFEGGYCTCPQLRDGHRHPHRHACTVARDYEYFISCPRRPLAPQCIALGWQFGDVIVAPSAAGKPPAKEVPPAALVRVHKASRGRRDSTALVVGSGTCLSRASASSNVGRRERREARDRQATSSASAR